MIENAQNEARERIKKEVIELCAYERYAEEAKAKILAENAADSYSWKDFIEDDVKVAVGLKLKKLAGHKRRMQ